MDANAAGEQHSVVGSELLLVQRSFFAGPFPEIPDSLYAQGIEGVMERQRERVVIQPHAQLSTNTFFGRFPASYWQRWTKVTQVTLSIIAQGTGQISIRASDIAGHARTLDSVRVDGAQHEQVRLLARVDRFVDGGAIWLEASTGAAALTLESACWSVTMCEPVRPAEVVICTFNRADDCLRTLETLSRDSTALMMVGMIYVVDQGNDTVTSRPGFTAVQHILGARLRYLRQPNLGGAGGFTRGLCEVTKAGQGSRSYVLFMDDDIKLEPDTVIRLTTFANCAVTPTIVGAQMLYLLHPDQLHVGAEATDLAILRAGRPVKDALVQSELTKTRQEIRVDAEYNAWWACLIPSEVVTAIGYPMPLFFQWDDIEYGLRAREHGYPTVTLPGAGVWHVDFHWKDWDDWPRYFSLRNSLIVNALYGQSKRTDTARFLLGQLLFYITSMRYGLAATLIMAVEDFLAGPDILHDGGSEAMAVVRKLRAEYPETTRHPAHQIAGISSATIPITAAEPTPSEPWLVLVKRLIWQFLRKPRAAARLTLVACLVV